MNPVGAVEREIVLVGGGHAHVQVLRAFAMRPVPGVRLTLVAREPLAAYSGMLPGLVAGCYRPEECHTNLDHLAQRAGARVIHAAATALDAAARQLVLADHPPLRYDLLSLNTGSVTPLPAAMTHPGITPVRPVDRFVAAWDRLVLDLKAGGPIQRIVLIGGGVAAVELALAMRQRLTAELAVIGSERVRPDLTLPDLALVTRGRLLADLPSRARRWLAEALHRRAVAVIEDAEVIGVQNDHLLCRDERRVPFDRAFAATGATAPDWIAGSGLAVGQHGFVQVDRTLRSCSHADIFAAGDIAAFASHSLPKSGVFAVRQGTILAENLRRTLLGQRLRAYEPQRHALALIGVGENEAVAVRGRWAAKGAWAWRLKQAIDRRWIDRFETVPGMPGAPTTLRRGPDQESA